MSSSKGPSRLEKYHHEKQSQIQGVECKRVLLDSVSRIQRIASDVKKHGISIELKDGSNRQFICDNEETAKGWIKDLNDLCKKRDSMSSSRSESAIDELFNVYLLPSPNLNIFGECFLQVSTDHINLFDVYDTNKKLVAWPITGLRRYGKDESKFTLEAGRSCATGEGIFSFNTSLAERIHTKVSKASSAIVAAYQIQRKYSDTPVKMPLERSQSESPVASAANAHSPVKQSISFPEPTIRPPAPLPRDSPNNSLPRPPRAATSSESATSSVHLAGGEIDYERAPTDVPPPPPMRKPLGGANGSVKLPPPKPPAPVANGETNNNDGDYIYEEKYLEPGFRQYLSERK